MGFGGGGFEGELERGLNIARRHDQIWVGSFFGDQMPKGCFAGLSLQFYALGGLRVPRDMDESISESTSQWWQDPGL